MTAGKFPEFLADATLTYMEHKVVSDARSVNGKSLSFVPLYRLHHHDGVDMVTVGGALCIEENASIWNECVNAHELISAEGHGPTYSKLDLVPFTVKEKIALDLCLPHSEEPNFIKEARRQGLHLSEGDLSKYKKYYKHFPVFAEATF